MTFFDAKRIDKLTPQQRAQYEQFLEAYPQLGSKMDSSRELNTPLAQAVKQGEKAGTPLPGDDEIDLTGIEREQRSDVRRPAKPIAEMKVDPARANMVSLDQEEKEKERRAQERLRKQRAEQARVQAEEDAEDAAEYAAPPPQQASPRRQEPAPKKKPPKFSPTGKRHPILQKMRQSLGMEDYETLASITIQNVKYSVKRLMREDITKAITLAANRGVDDAGLRSFMETAIVSYALREIDDTSVADVFEVPYSDLKFTTGKEETLTSRERDDKGAHLFFEFLVDSPTELTETLITFYEQNFPPVNLMGNDTTLALCPVSGCQYKAIIGANETRYCPIHGKELRKEGDLPNPS